MVVIAELYSHICPFSSLRKKEKLLKYFVLKSYIKWEQKKTKQKNEVKNNPWERSCNSEVVHLIVINGWETHRALEYEKKNHVGHFSLQHLSVELTIMYFG